MIEGNLRCLCREVELTIGRNRRTVRLYRANDSGIFKSGHCVGSPAIAARRGLSREGSRFLLGGYAIFHAGRRERDREGARRSIDKYELLLPRLNISTSKIPNVFIEAL
jgi:hypothetical protein